MKRIMKKEGTDAIGVFAHFMNGVWRWVKVVKANDWDEVFCVFNIECACKNRLIQLTLLQCIFGIQQSRFYLIRNTWCLKWGSNSYLFLMNLLTFDWFRKLKSLIKNDQMQGKQYVNKDVEADSPACWLPCTYRSSENSLPNVV